MVDDESTGSQRVRAPTASARAHKAQTDPKGDDAGGAHLPHTLGMKLSILDKELLQAGAGVLQPRHAGVRPGAAVRQL